jgi:hypothetical protein
MVAAAADLQFVMQDVAFRLPKRDGKNVIFNIENRRDEDGRDRPVFPALPMLPSLP